MWATHEESMKDAVGPKSSVTSRIKILIEGQDTHMQIKARDLGASLGKAVSLCDCFSSVTDAHFNFFRRGHSWSLDVQTLTPKTFLQLTDFVELPLRWIVLNAKDWAKEDPLDSGPSPFPGPVNNTGDKCHCPSRAQMAMAASNQCKLL